MGWWIFLCAIRKPARPCALRSIRAEHREMVLQDLFHPSRQMGTTTLVSVDSSGAQDNGFSADPSISANGQYVAFYSSATNLVPGDTNAGFDVFVRDMQSGTTTRVSVDSSGAQGNDYSSEPFISADGRYVGFDSGSTNLVPGDTN